MSKTSKSTPYSFMTTQEQEHAEEDVLGWTQEIAGKPWHRILKRWNDPDATSEPQPNPKTLDPTPEPRAESSMTSAQ